MVGFTSLNLSTFLYFLSFIDISNKQKLRLVSSIWDQIILDEQNSNLVFQTICSIPKFQQIAFKEFKVSSLTGGITNKTYLIEIMGQKWTLRIAGIGTSSIIDRDAEAHNASIVSKLGINVQIEWVNVSTGSQLTKFYADSTPLIEINDTSIFVLTETSSLLKKLHNSGLKFKNSIDIFISNQRYLEHVKKHRCDLLDLNKLGFIEQFMGNLQYTINKYNIPKVPCHNDLSASNFLLANNIDELKLIDWEYSGNNDLFWDIANFITMFNLYENEIEIFLKSYFGRINPTILAWTNLYKVVVNWTMSLWAYVQIVNGADSALHEEYKQLAEEGFELTNELIKSKETNEAIQLILQDMKNQDSKRFSKHKRLYNRII